MSAQQATEDIFTPSEAAREVPCSAQWIHQLARQGFLESFRTARGRLLIKGASLRAFIAARQVAR